MLHAHAVENDSHMNYSFVVSLFALPQKQENDFISPNGNVVNMVTRNSSLVRSFEMHISKPSYDI